MEKILLRKVDLNCRDVPKAFGVTKKQWEQEEKTLINTYKSPAQLLRGLHLRSLNIVIFKPVETIVKTWEDNQKKEISLTECVGTWILYVAYLYASQCPWGFVPYHHGVPLPTYP
jgi:hypothetical protein